MSTDQGPLATHIVIPDTQVAPGDPLDFLGWIGSYIVDQFKDKENVYLIQLGDHAHMASLSSYDKGKREMEGRRYRADIDAANEGFGYLNYALVRLNAHRRKNKERQWFPRERHLLLGNHENRINVAVSLDAKLEGTISTDDLVYEPLGWTVHPFLEVLRLHGVSYSHYFQNQSNGRPVSGMIETRIKTIGASFVQGHQQGLKTGMLETIAGRRRGIVAGSCYLKSEDYRGPQGRGEWRGILVLHEVEEGDYCLMEVSLGYLCRKYEGQSIDRFMAKRYSVGWAA